MEKRNLTEECFRELEKFKALSPCFLVKKFKITSEKAFKIMKEFEDNGFIDRCGKIYEDFL